MTKRAELRERMRRSREERGLTREELGRLAGCSGRLICLLEEDSRSVTHPNIAARILGECGIRDKECLKLLTHKCRWHSLPDIPAPRRTRRRSAETPQTAAPPLPEPAPCPPLPAGGTPPPMALVRPKWEAIARLAMARRRSYQSIALAVKHSRGYIYQARNKGGTMPYRTLAAIADELGVKPEEVMEERT